VAFLSGALDYYIRGYDLKTGAEIWRDRLTAGGQATSSTYKGADGAAVPRRGCRRTGRREQRPAIPSSFTPCKRPLTTRISPFGLVDKENVIPEIWGEANQVSGCRWFEISCCLPAKIVARNGYVP
jgi:hypothetical protein